MFKTAMRVAAVMSACGFLMPSPARADDWNKMTVITFSQAVEIPGQVLPAGTYTFKLKDSLVDRHIVQIFNADGTQIVATVMAIPNYRLKSTDETVIRFREVPVGQPEAIRAWFYPGNRLGQEFVYSKVRAAQLAKASQSAVPAVAIDVTSADDLRTAPVVAITSDDREVAIGEALQLAPAAATTPQSLQPVYESPMNAPQGRQLPATASNLPLFALLGVGGVALALGLLIYVKPRVAITR